MERTAENGAPLGKKQLNPPPIKHTVTSLLRIVKANPLLKYEQEKHHSQVSIIKDNRQIQAARNILKRSQSLKEKPTLTVKNAVHSIKSIQPKKVVKNCVNNVNNCGDSENDVSKPSETKTSGPSFSFLNEARKAKIDVPVITFKTPNAYKRHSVSFFTPSTERKMQYTPYTSSPAPDPADLKRKLDKWLNSRGKSLQSFHYLKCFDIKYDMATKNEENKENIEVSEDLSKGSYEDLRTVGNQESFKEHKISSEESIDLEAVAKEALRDLQKLILEEYPKEQCEAWLGSIRRKYRKLEEEPEYWECLAALEGAKANIGAAVDYYRTAIIQGAEVNSVDTSLEQLLEKFSLLNISATEKECTTNNKNDRTRLILDTRNAFKSTIIQFAMLERKLKKSNQEADKKIVVITPVRRSTRKSRTRCLGVPDATLYSSIQEARESVGEISFRCNRSLAARFNNE